MKGAGVERSPERPIATIEQVYALADGMDPCCRALVLTATFTGLRLGELRALGRSNLDLLHATVRVVEEIQELATRARDATIANALSDAIERTLAQPDAKRLQLALPGADEPPRAPVVDHADALPDEAHTPGSRASVHL